MRFYFIIIFYFFSISSKANFRLDTTETNPLKLGVVLVSGVSVLGGSYIYVQNSWWSDQSTSFHFDDGTDLRYARNIDKGGHFFGGILVADLFHSNLKWVGINENKSYWYGAAMGSFVQLAIEMKDAYAPYWGFSVWDFGIGAIGALVPAGLIPSGPGVGTSGVRGRSLSAKGPGVSSATKGTSCSNLCTKSYRFLYYFHQH